MLGIGDGKGQTQDKREGQQNCADADKVEGDQANNDSGCESDWYSRTCIHPGKNRALKTAKTELKAHCSNNKHMKRSY
eukprot:14485530-Ditylum_brightwellii.AAC.1